MLLRASSKSFATPTDLAYRFKYIHRDIQYITKMLLNVDYKIASKVIATRFEKVLDFLISPDQTGFLKGRYIGQNIRLVNDEVEQTKIQNIPGILVQLDFCKAFDTIEWSFIKRSWRQYTTMGLDFL